MLGKDLTTIDGLDPYLSLKLIAECGADLTSWPSAKHFSSWLGLAPATKCSHPNAPIRLPSGGTLRLAAATVGRTDTALSPFIDALSEHRQGQGRDQPGRSQFCSTMLCDTKWAISIPGASSFETRYRRRVVNNLNRRAKAFGFVRQPLGPKADAAVS
ncbi:IS110 family transposase [Bradyrhizobium sp. 174]|uniref:IS110 family transposase n=1 Tax=Bradyrhizobium sp. 174 TaxID=2782645 RepID=UPI001FFA55EA|nr:IS110 family transposase [Bradyrhizobium sp. 174]